MADEVYLSENEVIEIDDKDGNKVKVTWYCSVKFYIYIAGFSLRHVYMSWTHEYRAGRVIIIL